jgi:hypothetical protein
VYGGIKLDREGVPCWQLGTFSTTEYWEGDGARANHLKYREQLALGTTAHCRPMGTPRLSAASRDAIAECANWLPVRFSETFGADS